MNVVDRVREAGVVGAGGAGFPTHVKLNAKAEYVIANGAECEPLLRVDQLTMRDDAERVVKGLEAAMEATGAKIGIIATKRHYERAVAALSKAIAGKSAIRLHLMDSYYPSGDEKSIIFEVTGRVVPSGKLPSDVGCVVCNVGTLANIANAVEGKPVVQRRVTICGDVPSPVTVDAPIGTRMRELLPLAGFRGDERTHALIVGGPCMGALSDDWDAPVTKTTGGLLLLPREHPLIAKRRMPIQRQALLARAVCCQCSRCTQLCPRNALGLHVEPHKAMRAVLTGNAAMLPDPNGTLACSSCGLCTNFACDMGLTPSQVMARLKDELGKAGVRPQQEASVTPDPFVAMKRVPVKRLIARMGLSAFDVDAPMASLRAQPGRVRLTLRQHLGRPSEPVVQVGDVVRRGQLVAAIPDKALGAALHASIDGRVVSMTNTHIELEGGQRA